MSTGHFKSMKIEVEKIALEAMGHAHSKIEDSPSHVRVNQYEDEKAAAMDSAVRANRAAVEKKHEEMASLRLEHDDLLYLYESEIEAIKKYGNCGELARLAFDYIVDKYPNIRAEIFEITNGDHCFLVLGRNPLSDPNRPETWGENAYICDPLEGQVYKAVDFNKEDKIQKGKTLLKDYLLADKFYILEPTTDEKSPRKKSGVFYVVGLRERDDIQDPSKWSRDAYIADENGKKICSASKYLADLKASDKTFSYSGRSISIAEPITSQHQMRPTLNSAHILKHRKIENLVNSYNSKINIIALAVQGLINEFNEILRRNAGKKDKPIQQLEEEARGVLAVIVNLITDLKRPTDTKSYREVRQKLETRLQTATVKASTLSSAFFSKQVINAFPKKTSSKAAEEVKTALDTFDKATKKLKN